MGRRIGTNSGLGKQLLKKQKEKTQKYIQPEFKNHSVEGIVVQKVNSHSILE